MNMHNITAKHFISITQVRTLPGRYFYYKIIKYLLNIYFFKFHFNFFHLPCKTIETYSNFIGQFAPLHKQCSPRNNVFQLNARS
jgi:hypothetical protein